MSFKCDNQVDFMVLQREREAREEKSRAEWDAKFGRPYTASCISSYNLTDYCREQFGLPKRPRASTKEDGIAAIPEPYRRAVRPKTEGDVIGLYKDDYDQRMFNPHTHGIRRTVFD